MKNFDISQYKDPQEYEQDLKAKGCTGFCPIPWVSLGINNNGDYRMCVQAAANRKFVVFVKTLTVTQCVLKILV